MLQWPSSRRRKPQTIHLGRLYHQSRSHSEACVRPDFSLNNHTHFHTACKGTLSRCQFSDTTLNIPLRLLSCDGPGLSSPMLRRLPTPDPSCLSFMLSVRGRTDSYKNPLSSMRQPKTHGVVASSARSQNPPIVHPSLLKARGFPGMPMPQCAATAHFRSKGRPARTHTRPTGSVHDWCRYGLDDEHEPLRHCACCCV